MSKIIFPLFAFLSFSKMLVAQVDTVPPVIVCNSQINVTLIGFCQITVWSIDLIDTMFDNSQNIETGIRKICTGSGFPENHNSVLFNVNELGDQTVEVWAKDGAGNKSSCLTTVWVGDIGFCDPGSGINIYTPIDEGVDSVKIKVKGNHCYYGSIDYQIPDWWGNNSGNWSAFAPLVSSAGYNFTVTPSKNINPLNGVTTNDLLLIQKHILGIEPFDSPWKLIAADANQDGKVSTFDILILRKLILGITTELPNGKSWRFLPQSYTFPDPANPFLPPFPEHIEVPNTADPAPSFFAFKGVKIGDVDFSADPNQ